MGTESLQSLCTIIMVIGFVFTGLGGAGAYYFSHASRYEADLKRIVQEKEWNTKVSALQKTNGELRQRLDLLETMPASTGVTQARLEQSKALHTQESNTALHGGTIPVSPAKASAPPIAGATEWSEGPSLEDMVAAAASPAPKKNSGLNDKQREEMSKVLRKHAGRAISIHSVAGDSSGLEFAESLRREFMSAGWHVGNVSQVAYAKPPVGLYVSTETFPSPQEVIVTYQALTAAGLNVSQQLDPKMNGQKAVLLVGATLK